MGIMVVSAAYTTDFVFIVLLLKGRRIRNSQKDFMSWREPIKIMQIHLLTTLKHQTELLR